jgi:hypothetical protein
VVHWAEIAQNGLSFALLLLFLGHINQTAVAGYQTAVAGYYPAVHVAGYQTAVVGYQTAVAGYQTACTLCNEPQWQVSKL